MQNKKSKFKKRILWLLRYSFSFYAFVFTLFVALMLPKKALGVNIWEGTGEAGGESCNKAEGGCSFADFERVFLNILKFLFIIAIPIAVGMIVFGAFQMVISGGSPEKVKQGKDTMVKAIIGLVVVLASFLIVKTLEFVLRGGTGDGVAP